MSVSRSGYYKWKYRQEHPTMKMISRQSDIDLITEIHNKHKESGFKIHSFNFIYRKYYHYTLNHFNYLS